MSAPPSPDVLLDATERPRCPRCHLRMVPIGVSTTAIGSGPRQFRCPTCDQATDDPMKSGALGWLNSDLKPPR